MNHYYKVKKKYSVLKDNIHPTKESKITSGEGKLASPPKNEGRISRYQITLMAERASRLSNGEIQYSMMKSDKDSVVSNFKSKRESFATRNSQCSRLSANRESYETAPNCSQMSQPVLQTSKSPSNLVFNMKSGESEICKIQSPNSNYFFGV
jgi:hypothetical protein